MALVADERIDLPVERRASVARDLRALQPLPSPVRRALALVPVAIVLLFAAVVFFGLRRDANRIGVVLTWGASTLQIVLGLALVVAALRESVPGTTLPRRVVGAALGTVLVAVVTVTFMTWTTSPTTIAPGFVAWVWGVCLTGTIVSALPPLAIAGWLAARAFPLRPRLAGALYGVGAGLMADAGWRLFCHFSHPGHVFGAHTLGIAVTGVLGVVLALAGRRDDGGNGFDTTHILRGTFSPPPQSKKLDEPDDDTQPASGHG